MNSNHQGPATSGPGSHSGRAAGLVALLLVAAHVSTAHAEFPYPPCAGCADPADYEDYMHTTVIFPPTRPNEVGQYDRLRIGDLCLERTRTCEPNTSGEVLKCKKPKV